MKAVIAYKRRIIMASLVIILIIGVVIVLRINALSISNNERQLIAQSLGEMDRPIIDSIFPHVLDATNTETCWISVTGDNYIGDCYIIINGCEKDAFYEENDNTLTFKLEYSEWVLLDKVMINVARKGGDNNTTIISDDHEIPIRRNIQSFAFEYDWIDNHYIAHAFGGIDGMRYTNSLDAFLLNYSLGYRVFEVDLSCTSDGILTLRHDWLKEHYGLQKDTFSTYEKNNLAKTWDDVANSSEYTLLSFSDLLMLIEDYPDIYVEIDSKNINSSAINYIFKKMVDTAKKENHLKELDRMIIDVYNEEMFYQVMEIYPFKSVIYALYRNASTNEQVFDFVEKNSIFAVSCSIDRFEESLAEGLEKRHCKVYVYTVNDPNKVKDYAYSGAYGFYSDFLGDHNCNVDIDTLRDKGFEMRLETNRKHENYLFFEQYLRQLDCNRYLTIFSCNGNVNCDLEDEAIRILEEFQVETDCFANRNYSYLAIISGDKCIYQVCSDEKVSVDQWIDGVHIIASSVGGGEETLQSLQLLLMVKNTQRIIKG